MKSFQSLVALAHNDSQSDFRRECNQRCAIANSYAQTPYADTFQREQNMKLQQLFVGALMLAATAGASALYAADLPGPMQPEEIKWGPAPPVLSPGAKIAVLAGDPATTGLLTIRLKMPAGYIIAPHWHPTDEHVTVISGTFSLGMGDVLDKKQSKTLKAGGYAVAPANMHHFAWTKSGCVVQVNMLGPFKITYVNPADDPTQKK
jgi:quercetin dioxygenase-like cupin family protein